MIEPAEREIKEKCPFEVVHELAYDKAVKKGRPAIVGLTFSKILKPTLIKNPQDVLDVQLLNVLIKNFGFDDRGIRSNLRLFLDLKEKGVNVVEFLLGIEDRAKQAYSPQGYAIKSLQNLLNGTRPPQKRQFVTPEPSLKPVFDRAPLEDGKSPKSSKRSNNTGGRLDVKSADEFDNSGLEEI